ncbi:MAG: hypothetical protein KBA33_03800 [Cloacibacterium sp.]|jgi:hypothetical protein|nr:hypothetical protein [Cloacibacterium sp.]
MKIDIEKLERKTPYKTPDNFFEEVQERVLQETVNKKSPKRFSLNFAWATAAAIALVFGLGFFFNLNKQETPTLVQNTTANQQVTKTLEPAITQPNIEPITEEDQIIEEIKTVEQNLTSVTKTNPNKQQQTITVSDTKSSVNIDELLSSMSQEEISELSRMSEQDIYLDLYN